MPRTVVEKTIAAHTADAVEPGATVWLELDVRAARDFGGAKVVANFEEHYAGERVADAAKTFFTFDCVAPANTIPYATNQQRCRAFAAAQGIRVFDVDVGIGSHVLMEEGLARTGAAVVTTDSHMNVAAAVGCLGLGMGDADVAFSFRTGRTWLEVPASVKVEVVGAYAWPTTAKDLALALLWEFGPRTFLGKAVELYGPAVEALSLDGRITLCSMATELGAVALFLPPADAALAWSSAAGEEVEAIAADEGAFYEESYRLDVAGLEPLVARPPAPWNVAPARELAAIKVSTAFFGSCTNGRLEDFRTVGLVLAARHVAAGVVAAAVPATRRVYAAMLEEGLVGDLFHAGFVVSHAGCGGCAQGQLGMTGEGEVAVSTSNRNFPGKQGAGAVYLCSPATAAASALKGRVADPREVI